jgi:hypothetical protein
MSEQYETDDSVNAGSLVLSLATPLPKEFEDDS